MTSVVVFALMLLGMDSLEALSLYYILGVFILGYSRMLESIEWYHQLAIVFLWPVALYHIVCDRIEE